MPIGVNEVVRLSCPVCTPPLTQCVLGLTVAPAKQMKETGSTCCLCNESLEVLQGASSQDTHAEEGRAQDIYVWKQIVATDLIERNCKKKKSMCERCPSNPAQDKVN